MYTTTESDCMCTCIYKYIYHVYVWRADKLTKPFASSVLCNTYFLLKHAYMIKLNTYMKFINYYFGFGWLDGINELFFDDGTW